MKRFIALLIVVTFGLSGGSVFAQGATTLQDSEMDDIHAGDWVITTDGETVNDVYFTNNTIDLEDESQTEIQAVSNANVVDSATAVQTNVARVTGDEATENVAVAGANEATLASYRPGASSKTTTSKAAEASIATEVTATTANEESCSVEAASASGSEASTSESANAVYTLDETLDVAASSSAAGDIEDKSGDSEIAEACALTVDYDKDVDANAICEASTSDSSSESESLSLAKVVKASTSTTEKATESLKCEESESTETRTTLSQNNHINLQDVSQKSIQAVSNLNAVGAGAAIQANIASNVGVSGTISGSNTATVSSGL